MSAGGICQVPTEEHASRAVRAALGDEAVRVVRFASGLCHYVFDVKTSKGKRVVARISKGDGVSLLKGGVYWGGRLQSLGVPVPQLLAQDLEGRWMGFPCVILECLPGVDLGTVYATLTVEEKKRLAVSVVEIQRKVDRVSCARGYGFAATFEHGPFLPTWRDVLVSILRRGEQRLARANVFSMDLGEAVARRLEEHHAYYESVRPLPFLDDTTTKNLLIEKGRLSGIVDVDELCFGDQLLVIALTRCALICEGYDTLYTEAWFDAAGHGSEELAVLHSYTALFALDFLSGMTETFNRSFTQIDVAKVSRLKALIEGEGRASR